MCNLPKIRNFERKLESPYTHSKYIAEFWNTVSNLPFIIIGILRLCEEDLELYKMYILYTLCGFCSSFHHATTVYAETRRWTLIIDWAPITVSIYYILTLSLLQYVSTVTFVKLLLALYVLLSDHVYTFIPIPWGHAFWHVLAALAVDGVYQDVRMTLRLKECWDVAQREL